MSEATKAKLKQWIPDGFVLDLLEASGILYPSQVAEASDAELIKAGLNDEELAAVRGVEKFHRMAAVANARKLAESEPK